MGFLFTCFLAIGLAKGLIIGYFNWRMKNLITHDGVEKGLRILHIKKVSSSDVNNFLRAGAKKEYFRFVQCTVSSTGEAKRFRVKIDSDTEGHARLEWTEIA